MFWQVSKLVLTIWRNRLFQLFRRYPALWLLVVVIPLVYGFGTYLGYIFIDKSLQPFALHNQAMASLQAVVTSAFFCTFGLSAFILMISSTLFSPDETVIKRVFTPLPISSLQQRIGVLLPGILFLICAQISLWLPILAAMIHANFAPLPALLGATILGLLCYNAATLAFYQGTYYLIARLFGIERAGLRSTAVGLSISVGLIVLMIPLIEGGQALLAHTTSWLWLFPSFWMSLILSNSGWEILVGSGLLLAIALLCVGLYLFFIQRCENLMQGTKGSWIPLKQLPFGKNTLSASCIYEWKTASRDQQLIIGLGLVVGGAIASTVTIICLGNQNPLLTHALIVFSVSIITILMCAIAQMSWGRDRGSRRLLVTTPLNMRSLVTGKLLANLLAIIVCWCVLTIPMAYIGHEMLFLASQFPLLLLGILLAFWLGIAIPYASDDPFSMLLVMSIMTILGFPLYAIFQKGQELLNSITTSITLILLLKLGIGIIIAIGCYANILWLDKVRMEKDHD